MTMLTTFAPPARQTVIRAGRRGHRTQVTREDLLWGLLADASSESVGILRHYRVDIGRLWADLRRWHQST
jgi:hypothetical protein